MEPEDPDEGDVGYTTRSKRAVKPKSQQAAAKKESQPLSRKQCRKTLTKLLQLKAQQAVHGGANAEKPFECVQCGRGFSFQRSLVTHMLLHTGEQRPHPSRCTTAPKGQRALFDFLFFYIQVRGHTPVTSVAKVSP